MKIFGADISQDLVVELARRLAGVLTLYEANAILEEWSGIQKFYDSDTEFDAFKEALHRNQKIAIEEDRTEYGDFQTTRRLADNACTLLKHYNVSPKIVIEPTFGKGHFIIAALKTFDNLQEVVGVEIYKPYFWQAKFNILEYFLHNPVSKPPRISLFHGDVFNVDFHKIRISEGKILILGNPPWVTNADLTNLNSDNLPVKSNFKKLNGLDAMTGKGNFDIGESITLSLLRAFHKKEGHIAFLVKNSVVKNLVFGQQQNQFCMARMEKHQIDAAKEFGASVEASLFFASLGQTTDFQCTDVDFYSRERRAEFGWVSGKFVSNIENYKATTDLDGICQFEWRQGVKHDCSKIMEIERANGHFRNGKGDQFPLENELVFGLLKSSDLKHSIVSGSRKYTIMTQQQIGQETKFIQFQYPQTWAYLNANADGFARRKSSIYVGKPAFSIFGVGEYSYAPFKVAISGLYKNLNFSLVLPENGKPLMLDDTCYFLGFDKLGDAMLAFLLLNSPETHRFLDSLVFWDSKRAITKELLMRIDFNKLLYLFDFEKIMNRKKCYPELESHQLAFEDWENFQGKLFPKSALQIKLL